MGPTQVWGHSVPLDKTSLLVDSTDSPLELVGPVPVGRGRGSLRGTPHSGERWKGIGTWGSVILVEILVSTAGSVTPAGLNPPPRETLKASLFPTPGGAVNVSGAPNVIWEQGSRRESKRTGRAGETELMGGQDPRCRRRTRVSALGGSGRGGRGLRRVSV